jgi:Spy/CpxP family protein refolding chaperone
MAHIFFGSVLLLLAVAFAFKRHHFSRRHYLRRLFGSLLATPAQERALRDLIHSARDQLQQLHLDARGLRDEVGDVFRADTFDEARFASAEAKAGENVRQATGIIRRTLQQVHDILDEVQRRKVADWLASSHRCYGVCHY